MQGYSKELSIHAHQKQHDRLSSLPQEIIMIILSHLDNPHALAIVSQVSVLFYELSGSDVLWKKFIYSKEAFTHPSSTPASTMKQIFINEPLRIKERYRLFAPEPFRMLTSIHVLDGLDENELKLSPKKKHSSPKGEFNVKFKRRKEGILISTVKNKFLTLLSANREIPKNDISKLNSALNKMQIQSLELLENIIKKLNEAVEHKSSTAAQHVANFNHMLIELAQQYGKRASLFAPECLQKIWNYMQTNPHYYNLTILANVLLDHRLIFNSKLTLLMDNIISCIEKPHLVSAARSEKLEENIVEDVLAHEEQMGEDRAPYFKW